MERLNKNFNFLTIQNALPSPILLRSGRKAARNIIITTKATAKSIVITNNTTKTDCLTSSSKASINDQNDLILEATASLSSNSGASSIQTNIKLTSTEDDLSRRSADTDHTKMSGGVIEEDEIDDVESHDDEDYEDESDEDESDDECVHYYSEKDLDRQTLPVSSKSDQPIDENDERLVIVSSQKKEKERRIWEKTLSKRLFLHYF
jgi:hypothetical protein